MNTNNIRLNAEICKQLSPNNHRIPSLYMSRLVTKPTKWVCAQRRLRLAWASPLSAKRRLWSDWADAQAVPRLIWVFAGRTATLLVWSRSGSYFSDTEFNIRTVSIIVFLTVSRELIDRWHFPALCLSCSLTLDKCRQIGFGSYNL